MITCQLIDEPVKTPIVV